MRTTVTLSDDLYEVARRHAESLHIPLGEFIQTAMRQALQSPAVPGTPVVAYAPPRIRSGLRAGLTVESVSAMQDDSEDTDRLVTLSRP